MEFGYKTQFMSPKVIVINSKNGLVKSIFDQERDDTEMFQSMSAV